MLVVLHLPNNIVISNLENYNPHGKKVGGQKALA